MTVSTFLQWSKIGLRRCGRSRYFSSMALKVPEDSLALSLRVDDMLYISFSISTMIEWHDFLSCLASFCISFILTIVIPRSIGSWTFLLCYDWSSLLKVMRSETRSRPVIAMLWISSEVMSSGSGVSSSSKRVIFCLCAT